MKEKLSKVKEFVEENQLEIAMGIVTLSAILFGVGIGRYSMYEKQQMAMGLGVRAGVDFAKANGTEAAEAAIMTAYKLKK